MIERVDSHNIFPYANQPRKTETKRGKSSDKARKTPFSEALKEEEIIAETQEQMNVATAGKAELQSLFDEVFAAGRALVDTPSYAAAQGYRAHIKRFMSRALAMAYTVETLESKQDVVRRKRYTLVQEANTAIVNMIEGLRIGQQNPLKLLETINAINGILIDIIG